MLSNILTIKGTFYAIIISLQVYVHKYGGFAMSHNDYIAHYNKLVEALKQDGVKYKTDGQYMHVGYNSPFEMKNRRNEIWVEAEDQ